MFYTLRLSWLFSFLGKSLKLLKIVEFLVASFYKDYESYLYGFSISILFNEGFLWVCKLFYD